MEQEQILETTAQEVYPLDQAAIDMLAEIAQQELPYQVSRASILNYFARQHRLQGKWTLAANGKELLKTP